MQYIANYNHWVRQEWVDEILNSKGWGRPAEGKKPDSIEEEREYQRARDAGYKDSDIYFYMFDKTNVSFTLEFPFITGNYHWWITKMMPGNFMPMHIDPHTEYQANSQRYWMPWQDWQPGHIFMYEDTVTTNYAKGDLYCYTNSNGLHGAANIGYTPRIVLQISTYDQ